MAAKNGANYLICFFKKSKCGGPVESLLIYNDKAQPFNWLEQYKCTQGDVKK